MFSSHFIGDYCSWVRYHGYVLVTILKINQYTLVDINSFRTESRSQRLGLPAVAYGEPLTAALHKWCYFVHQMWAPVKVDQWHGLTCYWPICFSKNVSYWTISFSWTNYLLRRPRPNSPIKTKQSKWRRPVNVHLHSVSRRNRLYCCFISGMLRVVVLHRLGMWVRALTVMVTLRQLELASGPGPSTRQGRRRQPSSTLSLTGSTATTKSVTHETLAYLFMDYSIYLIFTHKCICVHAHRYCLVGNL